MVRLELKEKKIPTNKIKLNKTKYQKIIIDTKKKFINSGKVLGVYIDIKLK